MTDEALSKEMVRKRLKRIEGQIRGIERMIENGRDCESVITQLSAVRSAVEGVGTLVLNNYMVLCFRDSTSSDDGRLSSLARAIAIWGRIRVGDLFR